MEKVAGEKEGFSGDSLLKIEEMENWERRVIECERERKFRGKEKA